MPNEEKSLESWLWDAACVIRGEKDAPKYKDYILPLVFVKRLCDVFDDEINRIAKQTGSRTNALKLIDKDHKLVRFYLPLRAKDLEKDDTWSTIRTLTNKVGEQLTSIMRDIAKYNPRIQGIVDRIDFNATTHGQRDISEESLIKLIEKISQKRLGLKDVEPDIIGRSYEYLIRKFAEGGGQSAGEFYTPREVGVIMARIMNAEAGMEVYDPCCGSAGLLIKCELVLGQKMVTQGLRKYAPLKLYGQEFIGTTWAMANMNTVIHDMECDIEIGNTMSSPKFLEGNKLKRFDIVVANPMWNQEISIKVYEDDSYNRFPFGITVPSNADWAWVQHMYASLKPYGKMAIVLDTSSVTRGSGNQQNDKEKNIRQKFIENDLIEAVILLPENLFYNTQNAGLIIVINKNKRHPNEILMVDLTDYFIKVRPKNMLDESHIERAVNAYEKWTSEINLCEVVTTKDVGIAENDYNLLPPRYVKRELPKDWEEVTEKAFIYSKEALKKNMVFHFFSEVDKKTKSNFKKTGIGLISKKCRIERLGNILDSSSLKLKDIKGSIEPPVLSLTKDDGLVRQMERFEDSIAIEDLSKYLVVKKGWIVYNPMVIWEGAIHALYSFDLGVVSPAYEVLIPKGIDYRLLDYLLKTPRVLNEYRRLASGGVKRRRIVSLTDFKNILIPIPDEKTMELIQETLDKLEAQLNKDLSSIIHQAVITLSS